MLSERIFKHGPSRGARLRPLEVSVEDTGIERAIRAFKRAVAEDGILKELKKRRHHLKPGQKRRIKEREAARRRRKQARYAMDSEA